MQDQEIAQKTNNVVSFYMRNYRIVISLSLLIGRSRTYGLYLRCTSAAFRSTKVRCLAIFPFHAREGENGREKRWATGRVVSQLS